VFTGRRIEIAVFLLFPVFVAVRMFADIPLLLRNIATDKFTRNLSSWELVYQPVA
jgi:hypothetical protein